MSSHQEKQALEKYVNETAQNCIMKMTLEDKAHFQKCPDSFAYRLVNKWHIKEQYVDHISDRHISELYFDLSPDDFAFLVIQCIYSKLETDAPLSKHSP